MLGLSDMPLPQSNGLLRVMPHGHLAWLSRFCAHLLPFSPDTSLHRRHPLTPPMRSVYKLFRMIACVTVNP